jgi:hypothetical protein
VADDGTDVAVRRRSKTANARDTVSAAFVRQ